MRPVDLMCRTLGRLGRGRDQANRDDEAVEQLPLPSSSATRRSRPVAGFSPRPTSRRRECEARGLGGEVDSSYCGARSSRCSTPDRDGSARRGLVSFNEPRRTWRRAREADGCLLVASTRRASRAGLERLEPDTLCSRHADPPARTAPSTRKADRLRLRREDERTEPPGRSPCGRWRGGTASTSRGSGEAQYPSWERPAWESRSVFRRVRRPQREPLGDGPQLPAGRRPVGSVRQARARTPRGTGGRLAPRPSVIARLSHRRGGRGPRVAPRYPTAARGRGAPRFPTRSWRSSPGAARRSRCGATCDPERGLSSLDGVEVGTRLAGPTSRATWRTVRSRRRTASSREARGDRRAHQGALHGPPVRGAREVSRSTHRASTRGERGEGVWAAARRRAGARPIGTGCGRAGAAGRASRG
jgi:hypothetical protein